jgi:hypothetical protein
MDGCRGCTSNKGDNQYRFNILLCLLSLNGPLTAISNNMLDLKENENIGQTMMIHKTLHRKLKIERCEPKTDRGSTLNLAATYQ